MSVRVKIRALMIAIAMAASGVAMILRPSGWSVSAVWRMHCLFLACAGVVAICGTGRYRAASVGYAVFTFTMITVGDTNYAMGGENNPPNLLWLFVTSLLPAKFPYDESLFFNANLAYYRLETLKSLTIISIGFLGSICGLVVERYRPSRLDQERPAQ
jgi:hypothetical protein